jgi:hypothetical protein
MVIIASLFAAIILQGILVAERIVFPATTAF